MNGETNMDCAEGTVTKRVLDLLLAVAALAFVLAMLAGGGCINQYKNRVSVEFPASLPAGATVNITVTDSGAQTPTTTKNVIPSVTAPLVP